MKKVKNIFLRVTLNGQGIVNYDSNDQKNLFLNTNLENKMVKFDKFKKPLSNITYAKKVLTKTNNELSYKIKISSNSLRHAIFIEDAPYQSPNIISNDAVLISYLASPVALLRGYTFLNGKENLKRKSAFEINDAIQTNDSESFVEVLTRSGKKNTDVEKSENDTSLFYKESIGNIEYLATGDINLMQLQFVSTDQKFDRYALNPDTFDTYSKILKTSIKNANPELGYYEINGTSIKLPELGFTLSNDTINTLIRMLFERILKMNINRAGSFASVSKLEYKLVYDVINDTKFDDNGWEIISSKEDIDNFSIDAQEFYSKWDAEEAEKLDESMQEEYETKRDKKNQEKADRKEKWNQKKAKVKEEVKNEPNE